MGQVSVQYKVPGAVKIAAADEADMMIVGVFCMLFQRSLINEPFIAAFTV